jgi:hypothetical protein
MRWRYYKPYLAVYLDLGFLSLRTDLMHESYESDIYTYILLAWSFFKWKGKIHLYRPGYDLRKEKK